jgi:CheY-like chemotaxis protein
MLVAPFADDHPVATVLLIAAVLALVTAAVVFQRPIERFVNRVTKRGSPRGTSSPAGVLWVDDRPDHNARLLDSLRDQGVRVDVAPNVSDALARLGEREYAIVVSDVSRIDDGEAGLRQLDEASGRVPVVVFSRYVSTSEAYRDRAVVSSEAEIKDWLRAVDLLP